MCMCEQGRLHCSSQQGWYTPLSEHVYCVAVTFKMTELLEQRICIKFCLKLEYSSTKLFGWFRRLQLCATGDWQLHHDNAPTHASCVAQFFGETSNHPGDSAPLQPSFGACDFWLFPKLKVPLKGKRFQTISEIQENIMGQLMVTDRTVWGPKVLLWRGLRYHCPMCNGSCIFFNKCLYFS